MADKKQKVTPDTPAASAKKRNAAEADATAKVIAARARAAGTARAGGGEVRILNMRDGLAPKDIALSSKAPSGRGPGQSSPGAASASVVRHGQPVPSTDASARRRREAPSDTPSGRDSFSDSRSAEQ